MKYAACAMKKRGFLDDLMPEKNTIALLAHQKSQNQAWITGNLVPWTSSLRTCQIEKKTSSLLPLGKKDTNRLH
jgi:hypothetical protein